MGFWNAGHNLGKKIVGKAMGTKVARNAPGAKSAAKTLGKVGLMNKPASPIAPSPAVPEAAIAQPIKLDENMSSPMVNKGAPLNPVQQRKFGNFNNGKIGHMGMMGGKPMMPGGMQKPMPLIQADAPEGAAGGGYGRPAVMPRPSMPKFEPTGGAQMGAQTGFEQMSTPEGPGDGQMGIGPSMQRFGGMMSRRRMM